MKIAVLVSGLVTSAHDLINRNNKVLKEKFPTADFYYATWKGHESKFYKYFPNDKCFIFDEPIMHYHPYMDISNFTSNYWEDTKNWVHRSGNLEWTKHHTKQILIHSMLLNQLEKNYDVIVRTRFDAFIWKSKEANFTPYVEDTYINQRVNGFAITQKPMFKTLYESNYKKDVKMKKWLLDQLIIHPRKMINYDYIMKLHKDKKLRAAEYGWHQVLSEPYKDNHRNWHGWVNHDKNVEDTFIKEG